MRVFVYFRNVLDRTGDDQTGASLVEYALLISLIALVAFAAVATFGGELSSEYSEIAESLP